ncbi:MAG: tRNA (5-methylaminomethyl-2-thiouridine)(34)-methyltransferase MnmD [Sphingomonadales bacterium]|jgi:tRNA U34 5-methylaminomethyl-2-thiouridine-forming methyltransferase MnmC
MKNAVDSESLVFTATPDGSYTFHHPELQENYHSVNGARTESQYVYIDQGLSLVKKDTIHVFEMGFGTGLNAFLAWQHATSNHKTLCYTAIEKYPLASDLLPIPDFIKTNQSGIDAWIKIQTSAWNKLLTIDNHFNLEKIHGDLTACSHNGLYDIIFFDAFAPSAQPELWSENIFRTLFNALNTDGILVTYSSAGLTKRSLVSAGFKIERLKGPPGKKHMIRAFKLGNII